MYPITLHHLAENLSDEEFYRFCVANKDLRIERTADQQLLILSPSGRLSGRISIKLGALLLQWSENSQLGEVYGASAGFNLPNRAMRAPDACWVSHERLKQLPPEEEEKGFPYVCPNFVVEVRSESDRMLNLRRKMSEWLLAGVQLGWLVDPWQRLVIIYRTAQPPQIHKGFQGELSGENVLPGFVIELAQLGIKPK